MNAIAGIGDGIASIVPFGIGVALLHETRAEIGDLIGVGRDDVVNTCSGSYIVGKGVGQFVGAVAAGGAGASSAFGEAGAAGDFTQVSHWGSEGLESGDWVMTVSALGIRRALAREFPASRVAD